MYLFKIGPTNENGGVNFFEGGFKMKKGGIQNKEVRFYLFSTSTND